MHDLDHHQTDDDAASEVTRHENDHAHAHDQDVHCHDECDGDGDVNGEVLSSHHLVMSTKPKAVVVEREDMGQVDEAVGVVAETFSEQVRLCFCYCVYKRGVRFADDVVVL